MQAIDIAVSPPERRNHGWSLTLTAFCDSDAPRVVRFLTGAVMACGGCVLSRRLEAQKHSAIRFQFARAICVEMYGVLLAAGLHLTAESHRNLAALCQCTRETMESTATDIVYMDLTIRVAPAPSSCSRQVFLLPPALA